MLPFVTRSPESLAYNPSDDAVDASAAVSADASIPVPLSSEQKLKQNKSKKIEHDYSVISGLRSIFENPDTDGDDNDEAHGNG